MQWKSHLSEKIKEHLPTSNLYLNRDNLNRYFEFGYERNKIWKSRFVDKKDFPWTDDPIMRDINFCNTYRILDRNSQWEISNITLKNKKIEDYIWNVIFFRYFNSPIFFEFLKRETNWESGIPTKNQYDKDLFLNLMTKARSEGINPFTSAYLTNSVICPKKSRDYCFSNVVIPNLIEKVDGIVVEFEKGGNEKKFTKYMVDNLFSCSYFLAHEFYVSLCFSERIGKPFESGWSHDTYANVGPGCSCGIRMVFPNLKNNNEQYEALKFIRKIAPNYIKKNFPDFIFTKYCENKKRFVESSDFNLTLLTFEHWFCEYSKLWRIREDLGGKRKKYRGSGNNEMQDFFLY